MADLDLPATPVAPAAQPEPVEPSTPVAEAVDPQGDPTPTPKPQNTLPKGVIRRFGELTRKREETENENSQLREELARLRGAQQPATPTQQPAQRSTNVDPNVLANQIVEQREFDRACNKVYTEAKTEFTDFDQKLGELGSTGLLTRPALAAIVDGDVPHKVLYHLASNFDVAMEILGLPERQMVRALARLETKLAAEPPAADDDDAQPTPTQQTNKVVQISRTPPPVKPVGSRTSTPSGPSEKDSVDTWMEKRKQQLRKK